MGVLDLEFERLGLVIRNSSTYDMGQKRYEYASETFLLRNLFFMVLVELFIYEDMNYEFQSRFLFLQSSLWGRGRYVH